MSCLLVDGYFQRLHQNPLGNVVDVRAQEEDQDKHEEHAPELATPPLRQTHLGHHLAAHVVQLLAAWMRHSAFTNVSAPV